MYTCDHPAWDAAPGLRIEMPALTSDVAKFVDKDSEFAEAAGSDQRVSRSMRTPMPMRGH